MILSSKNLIRRFLGVGTVILAISPAVVAAENRRLNVNPGQSIADEVRKNGSAPGLGLHLTADTAGGGPLFEVNVRVALPAVTGRTTTSVMGGESTAVDPDLIATVLVSDEDDTVALIAVEKNGNVNGIVEKGGKGTKFTQKGGHNAFAYEAEDFEPPAWACGVGSAETNLDDSASGIDRRFLTEDHLHEDHHDHDHHDHQGHHDHDHDFSAENAEAALDELRTSLRGSNLRLGKRRKLQGAGFNYQVDVYVEIDYTLCSRNGETCDNGIGEKTLNYVNALFAGANTIYESEIDTHLGVSHIDLNRNYDGESSTSNALTKMRSIYAQSSWHYDNTDLHTALLGSGLGGGIAYVGVLCNSNYGFGLSASLSGSFVSMDRAVVWDMMVHMHEIGHNFGTGHTHQDYSPLVDGCGNQDCAGLPLAYSTTIMSYCHLCSGGYGNMMYTFGGKYDSGPRNEAGSYTRSNLAGSKSFEPQRVNAKMWNHVSTRAGGCLTDSVSGPTSPPTPLPTKAPVAPTLPPTSKPTSPPTPKPTDAPQPPTPPPTSKPTNTPVDKYICTKWRPSDANICTNGSLAGGECTSPGSNNSCGKGGKSCWWASTGCPGGSGPTPPPATPPPSPSGGGNVCSSSSCQNCSGGGDCKGAGCRWSKGVCS